ncbi:MAG: hypothetical protein GXP08_03080 [Gammaproteobacteria bacterium]|nr:hypothetical protein [Gammaproteobacteria bacterium]
MYYSHSANVFIDVSNTGKFYNVGGAVMHQSAARAATSCTQSLLGE